MSRPHILIVGAGGTVGSRLARLLARSGLFRVSLGARDGKSVLALGDELRSIDPQGEFGFAAIDRARTSAERLKEIGCWIVVDCAGPSRSQETVLVEAAIAAHCHFIDIEDGRGHLDALRPFDGRARAMGVAVLSGAGTTPALTHAVCNSLAAGWKQVDSIDIALLAGSVSEQGPSRLAMLQGRRKASARVFSEGDWLTSARPMVRKTVLEGFGARRVAILDGTDLDLLAARFRPRLRAQLSTELAPGWPSRLLRRVAPLTPLSRLARLGRRDGGMVVEVAGLDARLEPKVARWTLLSQQGDETYLPAAAAAATIVALVKGLAKAGVHTAAGVVTLEGVRPWLAALDTDIKTAGFKREVPLLSRVLGTAFADLPGVLQKHHRGRPAVLSRGAVAVIGATNPAGRVLARLLGLPAEGSNVPFRVLLEAWQGREHTTRWFGETAMRSARSFLGEGLVEERLGPLRLRLAVVCGPAGLEMTTVGGRLGPLPLPRALLPRLTLTERPEGARLGLDGELRLPLLGRIFGYRGWLAL